MEEEEEKEVVETEQKEGIEEQQKANRETVIRKVEVAVQMQSRALRTRTIFVMIFFLALIAFTLYLARQDFLFGAAQIILVIVTVWHLKHENDFIDHVKETYGV